MNAAEFLEALENGRVTHEWQGKYEPYEESEDSFWSEVDYGNWQVDGQDIKVLETGGGMDEGSNAYVVFSVGGDTYFKKSGYYASHYGYDWDGSFEEVEPYEKSVTFYRPVK